MSTLSLHLSPSAVARRSHRRSWFARFFAALQASRMRKAQEVIAQHRHLLPTELQRAGDKLNGRNEDLMSFTRND
jgi:signal-transduction protein with cAMP-binding, CBS, and nucleotidyltransferase domain